MIVDFQHHFTPRELIKDDPGDRLILHYDESGAPSYTVHRLLYDLDEHIAMMDRAGIDAAFLTSAAGMCADLPRSRLCNDKASKRSATIRGASSAPPMRIRWAGPEAMRELDRCRHELGFPGVTITSEMDGLFLDAPELDAVLGGGGAAEHVRVRASGAQAQPSRNSSTATTRRARSGANSRSSWRPSA